MRDFLDGTMRPRDFSVFSLALGERKTAARSRDKSARVHAIEAAARQEKGNAKEEGDERGCADWRGGGREGERSEDRVVKVWRRMAAGRTRVSCGASTRCRGNNR
jgi:hypothetical protein